jgi:hypothetical protein
VPASPAEPGRPRGTAGARVDACRGVDRGRPSPVLRVYALAKRGRGSSGRARPPPPQRSGMAGGGGKPPPRFCVLTKARQHRRWHVYAQCQATRLAAKLTALCPVGQSFLLNGERGAGECGGKVAARNRPPPHGRAERERGDSGGSGGPPPESPERSGGDVSFVERSRWEPAVGRRFCQRQKERWPAAGGCQGCCVSPSGPQGRSATRRRFACRTGYGFQITADTGAAGIFPRRGCLRGAPAGPAWGGDHPPPQAGVEYGSTLTLSQGLRCIHPASNGANDSQDAADPSPAQVQERIDGREQSPVGSQRLPAPASPSPEQPGPSPPPAGSPPPTCGLRGSSRRCSSMHGICTAGWRSVWGLSAMCCGLFSG